MDLLAGDRDDDIDGIQCVGAAAKIAAGNSGRAAEADAEDLDCAMAAAADRKRDAEAPRGSASGVVLAEGDYSVRVSFPPSLRKPMKSKQCA